MFNYKKEWSEFFVRFESTSTIWNENFDLEQNFRGLSSEIRYLNRFFSLNRIVNDILSDIRDMHQIPLYGGNS